MNLKVKSLWQCKPSDFTNFLERLDYGHAPHWAGCYCRFYHIDMEFEHWKNRLPLENKIEALDAMSKREMHGFMAFDSERCIGWLNANDVETYVRLKNVLPAFVKDKKVALTICFVIDPQYRNQKVATSLLETAIRHYRDLGYDGMLAAPIEADGDFALKYRGTPGMYEKFGYELIEKMDRLSVYWLDFHKVDQ
jgi:GNAT superfamily N-acetyltransferase